MAIVAEIPGSAQSLGCVGVSGRYIHPHAIDLAHCRVVRGFLVSNPEVVIWHCPALPFIDDENRRRGACK
jgi:hypothetical protein